MKIMVFNIAIIMCLGINNKDNKVISKNNSKNIIHKEVVDGVEIEILADSGVFPKDASDDTSYFMIEDAEDLCLFRDIVNGEVTGGVQVEYVNEDRNNKQEDLRMNK